MEWIQQHWKDCLDVVAYVVLAASVVAKLTPTTVDDTVVGKLLQVFSLAKAPRP